MVMSTLPILPLQQPSILLPASKITVTVKRELGQQLISLIQDSESQPVVVAVPVITAESKEEKDAVVANEWGTVARIARLVRPSALNPNDTYLVTLHGLSRVRLGRPLNPSSESPEYLHYHPVEYPPSEQAPSKEAVEKFKKAALQMLGRLGQDASKASRRDAWVRFANMVEDITDRRVGWLSDLMVGSIITDYDDRLGEYCPTHTCSAMSFVFGMYK